MRLAIKDCVKTFLKEHFEKFLKNFKNVRRFDVLGRHYQATEKILMFYKYKKNNSSFKRKVTYKNTLHRTLNKEFSTNGVTLSVKPRPKFFAE